jgi:hypothetical protein
MVKMIYKCGHPDAGNRRESYACKKQSSATPPSNGFTISRTNPHVIGLPIYPNNTVKKTNTDKPSDPSLQFFPRNIPVFPPPPPKISASVEPGIPIAVSYVS